MSYRVWPAGLLTAAALAAAGVVVGGHVVETGDGCLGSKHFVGTPVSWSTESGDPAKQPPSKAGIGWPEMVEPIGRSSEVTPSVDVQISGCLDVARIEFPVTDGRA